MDFYLSLGGSKAGPFSIFKVGELLEQGEATADTLAWHRGLDQWRPIHEIAALEVVLQSNKPQSPPPSSGSFSPKPTEPRPAKPLPEDSASGETLAIPYSPAQTLVSVQTRPFIRFWARMFDYTLVSVIVFQLSDIAFAHPESHEAFGDLFNRYLEEMKRPEAAVYLRTLFLALLGWHALEGVLINIFGTTPGKALFGLKVKMQDGGFLPLKTSIGRSFYVYVLGVGFYQFPFIIIGMIFSFFRLNATGFCLWDQHLNTEVKQSPLGTVRILLAIVAFFVLLTLQSIRIS